MLLFGYFCQDNCDIGFLAGGLDIRVQLNGLISFTQFPKILSLKIRNSSGQLYCSCSLYIL